MPADGVVYSETIVHAAPEVFAADAPYQLAILDLDDGGRLTARILGKTPTERAVIGDRVQFVEERGGVAYYSRAPQRNLDDHEAESSVEH